jgi:exodeoxyribonuclease V beta subunit
LESIITLADFPKGAGSGDLFHAIFEALDFRAPPEEITAKIHSMFERYGFFDPDLVQMGNASVVQILETPLLQGKSGFCLKDVRFDQRFNEMEFLFPIHSFQLSCLETAFEKSDIRFKTSGYVNRLARLSLPAVKGFMKGFIDLVIRHNGRWYILDYKSNFLGDTYDHYSQDAMFNAMADHHYFLQYHIYIVALHRYLALRLKGYDYDRDFGGVFYLFIRGMLPRLGSGYGVFFHRPEKEAVIHLSDII